MPPPGVAHKKNRPVWKFDANNYPDQRNTWNSFSKGQKWYTIQQYNNARHHRGLERIDNPYATDNPDTVTPRTPGNRLITPIPKMPGQPSILSAFSKQKVAGYDAEAKELEELFNTAEGKAILDQVVNEASIAGPSGVTTERTVGQKSKAGEQGGKEAQRQATESPSTTTSTTEMVNTRSGAGGEAMEVGTAGTAAPAAGSAGGGRGFSGGFSTATGPEVVIPRPRNFMNGSTLVYNKVHRVLAYGLANAILELPRTTPAEQVLYPLATTGMMKIMTTSLMEIPWDRAFLFMNPGEFDSLPPGTYAKSVNVRVVQRNPRVAFETGATTTTIATLNQNKFGIKAVGLNKKAGLRTTNFEYTGYNATEPMIPSLAGSPNYADMNLRMYGYSQYGAGTPLVPTAEFDTFVPAHPFMIPIAFPNYLNCWNFGFGSEATAAMRGAPGWYSLSEHVTQFDMQATAGSEILNETYSFTYAPLTAQLPGVDYMTGSGSIGPLDNISFTDGSNTKQLDRINLSNLDVSLGADPTETFQILSSSSANFTPATSISIMEQGQHYKKIDSGSTSRCQPSLHIGISPVPRLTTTANTIFPNSWTDVQVYYEIHCSMEIGFAMPHHNTHTIGHNVEMESVNMAAASTLSTDFPIRFHHYPETFP